MQTHYCYVRLVVYFVNGSNLYSYTHAGDDHFPQQVVGSLAANHHTTIVTSRGILPHRSQGIYHLVLANFS